MSLPEKLLWAQFRNRLPGRPTIRRQHPFPPYVLDFYCMPAWLAIEVDGWAHTLPEKIEHDLARDAWLRSKGVEVLRVSTREVLDDPQAVADKVWRLANERARMLKTVS
jgi:very-short-patch-repair endonuclease